MRFEKLRCGRMRREPEVDGGGRVKDGSVSVSLGSLDLAHRINRGQQSTLGPLPGRDERPSVTGGNDTDKRPRRVDGQEHIVQHDKPEERSGLADRPGLSPARSVVLVERFDDDRVDDGDVERDLDIEPCSVNVFGDCEWRIRVWRGSDGCRFVCRGIIEERRRREGESDRGMVRCHDERLTEMQPR